MYIRLIVVMAYNNKLNLNVHAFQATSMSFLLALFNSKKWVVAFACPLRSLIVYIASAYNNMNKN
ncbi:hypothetical protein FOXB_15614 [Fusarium oxysporum f. sp. conglutinans Fo5176]|uniref:Uncharacterized protein n=1 Tax=Fusarium oxysporum (strain Fo5176) TaxID=660025 RepID=F9GAD2_FUSOF|nr:hypothetical protein FOXB_15614 [Fusarium oxysporum f. sp. conglutinans Fo5176]